ncbi:MAG: type II secretion system protein [Tissierellia bacterium]|nr:type II secretion system protein [Tissierellia bacterium]
MKKKGFTLLETIVAIGFIAIIYIFILPALSNAVKSTKISNDNIKNILYLQKAIEESKKLDIGTYTFEYNSLIEVEVMEYSENLKFIRVDDGKNILEVVVEK